MSEKDFSVAPSRVLSPSEGMVERYIVDEEDGPVVGICIDLRNGRQFWCGEISKAL
jgi:hypothetical protein